MKKIAVFSLLLLLIVITQKLNANNDSIFIYKYDIKEEIAPPVWEKTKKAFKEANEMNADLVLIHMNTYGGMVDAADSIRTKILNSKIPVVSFIDNNAASAGALISIACDRIYMRKGANIGAATVVNQQGEQVPDKYQSFMRAMMRSTAESHGKDTIISGKDTIYQWHRDPSIAEAMVDPTIYVKGVSDTGKVLTFTTSEAIENNFCEGIAENIEEVLKQEGFENYKVYEQVLTPVEKAINWLINPYFHSLLIMIIIGGIYFELQSPGIGFPLGAAIVAALLYFAPLYLEGLAENWEIIVFILGLVLIAVEVFAIPGFGIAGISGIFLVIFGLSLSMVDNVDFEFTLPELKPIIKSIFIVSVSMFVALLGSMWLSKKLFTTRAFPHLALNTVQEKSDGFVGVDSSAGEMVGKTGIAMTVLRPSGKVEIDNTVYDAMSVAGFIEAKDEIIVKRFEAGQLYVQKHK